MTPEERQLLTGLFDRVRDAASQQRDREAEDLINNAVREQPHAPYALAQAVLVQEEALKAAMAKIEELEGQVKELEEQASRPAEPASFLGGIGKSLFGGNEAGGGSARPGALGAIGGQPGGQPGRSVPASGNGISVPPRPGSEEGGSPWTHRRNAGPDAGRPGAAGPGAAGPGMRALGAAPQQEQGGGSFLKGALGAAAGVAGGMLLANAVGGLFSGKNNPLGINSANAATGDSKSAGSNAEKEAADNSGDWNDGSGNADAAAGNDSSWNDNAGWDDAAGDDYGDDWGDDGGGDWSED